MGWRGENEREYRLMLGFGFDPDSYRLLLLCYFRGILSLLRASLRSEYDGQSMRLVGCSVYPIKLVREIIRGLSSRLCRPAIMTIRYI
jgi:hypothetical protein